MSELAVLLQAIAALLWPLFAFTALLLFRPQIVNLVGRLKKGKLLGQEIELNESLKQLDQSATSVEREVAALPVPEEAATTPEERVEEAGVVRLIIAEAARSPKAALILLASELERLAREILATTGHLEGRRFIPVNRAIIELDKKFGLPKHIPSSLKFFWEARNRLIHGGEGTDEDILRAVDSGLTILKALQAMPRETNVVHDPSVVIYNDPELKNPMSEVHAVLLETHAPGGASKSLRIFPTTRTHFKKGHHVAWEWNMSAVFGQAWYRDPATGKSKLAWSSAAEFIGRHLDSL
ncbi:hypothetical protein [Nitrosospira briensis]|uniref:hypothetical protein n=1 Tax=Nitrosospira briensis TaxID=35799 RepID=UPI0008E9DB87|nr:hypothetical protein [Nitrosospira briensis]SFO37674.1 hypothetical protein SAMN05216332_112110 [Nitrosospira briensis]